MRQTIIRLFLVTIFVLVFNLMLGYEFIAAVTLAFVASYILEGVISEKLK